MARRRRTRAGRFTRSASSRRRRTSRRRRNPALAPLAMNPPRRRRRRGVGGFGRRRARRNPAISRGLSGLIPPVRQILEGAVGAAATRLIPGLASQYISSGIPVSGFPGYAVKAGAAVAAGYIGSMVMGPQCGRNIAAGGFIVLMDEILRDQVYPSVPMPLGAYLSTESGGSLMGMDAYLSPGAGVQLENYLGDDDGIGSADMPSRLDPNERF